MNDMYICTCIKKSIVSKSYTTWFFDIWMQCINFCILHVSDFKIITKNQAILFQCPSFEFKILEVDNAILKSVPRFEISVLYVFL